MIIDCITYNGERELFELRYNILKSYVDEFIVVEFDKTFSGQPKSWRFIEDFKGYKFKNVCYHGIEEKVYSKYEELAESSPNTQGASHWKVEFMMKESIKDALLIHHLKDDDICFIGDVDELWSKEALEIDLCQKLKLRVYTYYLNNRSSEEFWGGLFMRYETIRDNCLNDLRNNSSKTEGIFGWHFTSMAHQLERKLKDSYTEEDYATPAVLNRLEVNIKNNKDFLGRDFTYKTDEIDLPRYLLDNKERYAHLFR